MVKPLKKPEWATGGSAVVTEPTLAKKQNGWKNPEKPSDGVWNWLHYVTNQWIDWLDDQTDEDYLIGRRLTAGDNVTLTDNEDGTERIDVNLSVTSVPSVADSFSQASHGFSVKDQVRHNGTAWIKAQADTIMSCTDVWTVTAVADTDNFTATKEGRVTITSHGLTVGALYYLSPSTAGGLTDVKPVGTLTQPLGFFLPVIFVESANVLHVLGKPVPEMNSVLAEYIPTSDYTSTLTFSNLDVNSMPGKRLRIETVFYRRQDSGTASGPTPAPGIRVNNVSSNDYQCSVERVRAASTFTRNDFYYNNTTSFLVGSGEQSRIGLPIYNVDLNICDGRVFANGELRQWFVSSSGWGYLTGQSNITSVSLLFSPNDNSWRLFASDDNYVRLFWDV